jgi:hypothetical protein
LDNHVGIAEEQRAKANVTARTLAADTSYERYLEETESNSVPEGE